MARTIAEILAYNRNYSPDLNPKLFDEDGVMYSAVHNKILEIVETFFDYAQIEDVKIQDVRVVGSNASYNYNDDSDLDVHIVVDLSKISKPETIAQLYFTEVKHAFKEAYDITIKGIDVEIYVEDVNVTAVTNGIYSVTHDKWIKEPEKMKDPTESELSQAEAIEEEIIDALDNAKDADEKEAIINQLYVMRKDALASKGETAPANLAFKSLRNKGILKRTKDDIKKYVSKKLSLESKKMRESVVAHDTIVDLLDKSYKAIDSGNDYGLSPEGDELDRYVRDTLNNMPIGTEFRLPDYSNHGAGWHNNGKLYKKIDKTRWEVITIEQDDSLREKGRWVANASRLVTEFYQYVRDCGYRYIKENKSLKESKISSKVRGNINTDMKDMVQSMIDAPIGTKIVVKADNRWHDVRAIYEKVGEDKWKHTHQVNGETSWDSTRSTESMYSELWNSIYSGTVISESKSKSKRLKESKTLADEMTDSTPKRYLNLYKGKIPKYLETTPENILFIDGYDDYDLWKHCRLNFKESESNNYTPSKGSNSGVAYGTVDGKKAVMLWGGDEVVLIDKSIIKRESELSYVL